MTRKSFIPAKQLNLLAAGFIQFNLHDWFDHGTADTSKRIKIDLDKDDPVYKEHRGEMKIPRTRPDSCQKYSVIFIHLSFEYCVDCVRNMLNSMQGSKNHGMHILSAFHIKTRI